MGATNVRYIRRINARERWTGYLWQGRFASFAMDEDHLRTCTSYVGLNPVRAGLVQRAVDWPWFSVRAHVQGRDDPLLTPGSPAERLGEVMAGFFLRGCGGGGEAASTPRLRHVPPPLGAADWIRVLEARTGRVLADPPLAQPRKAEER